MRLIASCLAFLLISTISFAGTNRWTTSGPGVGPVSRIAVDPEAPDILFVATSAGFYKSTDAGGTWLPAEEGLPSASANAFVVAAGEPVTLYTAIGKSIWASTDLGEHWLPRGNVGSTNINGYTSVNDLVYDSVKRTLYAVANDGLHVSRDAGANWTIATETSGGVIGVHSFAVSATYAYIIGGTSHDALEVSIFRSGDSGQTWDRLEHDPVYALYANQDSRTLYGVEGQTVFISNDDANSWTESGSMQVKQIYSIVPFGATAYAATNGGVFAYDGVRRSWTSLGSSTEAFDVAIASSPSPRIYATGVSGIAELVDGNWMPENQGLPGDFAMDVAISAGAPSIAYMSTTSAVFLTEDAGQSWNELAIRAGGEIVVSPDTPDTAYAAGGSGINKTSDRGITWHRLTSSSTSRLAIASSDSATLYAALADGVAKSTDAGNSWTETGSGIDMNPYDSFYGYGMNTTAMAVNPTNEGNVAIATDNGLFVTADGGGSWQRSSSQQYVSAVAFDASSALYAAHGQGGVIRSPDGGKTWISAGLVDKTIDALVTSGTVLFAGTEDGHIYRSDDGGKLWNAFEDGLSSGRVLRIVVDASGEQLYAATAAGVYEFHLVDQNLRPQPFEGDPPRSFDNLLKGTAFVLPVIGNTSGEAGTLYSSEMTLTNERDAQQQVIVAWFPRASAAPALFRVVLPPGDVKIWDVNKQFGVDGIGALAIIPVDDNGQPDGNATIHGSARIWSHPGDGRAPFSQAVGAVRSTLLDPHARAAVTGIAQDAQTRINVGIVNLSAEAHQFTIQMNGERGSAQLTFAVPALSIVQMPAPDGDLGAASIEAFADDANTRWVFYGSAIDRFTGHAQTFVAQPTE